MVSTSELCPEDFEYSEDTEDMTPNIRASLEDRAYKKLAAWQGRNVPRCYGVILFRYHAALLLQYIDGLNLEESYDSSPKSVTRSLETPNNTIQDLSRRQQSTMDPDHGKTRRQPRRIDSLASKITGITRMLNSCGVKGDFKADNFICRGGTLWILDFDIAEEDSPKWVEAENLEGSQELLKTLGSNTASSLAEPLA